MEKVYLVTRQHKLVGLTFVKLHGSAAFIIQHCNLQLLHMNHALDSTVSAILRDNTRAGWGTGLLHSSLPKI